MSWLIDKIRRLSGARTYECGWVLGHGGFILPDPTQVSHNELSTFVRGKRTRITIEILGDIQRAAPKDWVPGLPAGGSADAIRSEET